jgi:hypothetical protein
MPSVDDRIARLYYDRGCGSCSVFARVAEEASHRRLVAVPLDTPAADRDLSGLPAEVRFGSAHLVTEGSRLSGPAIVTPLLGFAVGARLSRLLAHAPLLDRSLRWLYLRFWNHHQTRGCGTPRPG